ncbi:helicase-related protein, partial [uncultured Amnibacterium sp.]|uniref:helicase-related protein n=1 Tax=uncultured Amnibacterium sp. TaxID=1631851 RepID=UPI0035CA1CBE
TDVAARGIDVDDVTHVINHTLPEDADAYLHRVGRTGRAGRTGIAVTFVDWDDLHKWALIDKALEFGKPEPVETYSSSPHLYEELGIPAGTKGRLRKAAVAPGAPAEAPAADETRPARSRTRTRRDGAHDAAAGTTAHAGSAPHRGSGHDGSAHEGAAHEGSAHEAHVPGSGTHDGAGQPRRRRRRRGPRPATPSA